MTQHTLDNAFTLLKRDALLHWRKGGTVQKKRLRAIEALYRTASQSLHMQFIIPKIEESSLDIMDRATQGVRGSRPCPSRRDM